MSNFSEKCLWTNIRGSVVLFLAIVNLVVSVRARAVNQQYIVLRTIDGDSFISTDGTIQFQVRMIEIDTPAQYQRYNNEAKNHLNKLIKDEQVG